MGGRADGGMCRSLRVGVVMGRLPQIIHRIVSEADELLRDLELLILEAETFELEPEHVSRSAGELAADRGADRASSEASQGPAHKGQRLFGDGFQRR